MTGRSSRLKALTADSGLVLMAASIGATAAVAHAAARGGGQAAQQPEGYRQMLPRGGIPAIDEPQWVAASEANIPGPAYVFGIVVEGQARAFSINLLNTHEVVDDKIGATAYAAVW